MQSIIFISSFVHLVLIIYYRLFFHSHISISYYQFLDVDDMIIRQVSRSWCSGPCDPAARVRLNGTVESEQVIEAGDQSVLCARHHRGV